MDAVGEVSVRLRQDGALSAGHGADTDILVAAAKAYVHALNRLTARVAAGPRDHPGADGGMAASARRRRRGLGGRMTPRTLFDKIWDAHVVVEEPGEPVAALRRPPPRPRGHLAAGVRGPSHRGPAPCAGRGWLLPRWTTTSRPTATGSVGADEMSRAQMDALRTQLRRVRHRVLRRRTSLAGHRARDRPGAGAHPPRQRHRLRRLAHRHARGLRGIRARHRHLRGRARAGDAVPAPVASADHGGAHRGHAARSVSRPRTRRSASSTPSAPRAPRVTSSSTPARSCAASRWSSA